MHVFRLAKQKLQIVFASRDKEFQKKKTIV